MNGWGLVGYISITTIIMFNWCMFVSFRFFFFFLKLVMGGVITSPNECVFTVFTILWRNMDIEDLGWDTSMVNLLKTVG